jgi:low affinity Fe/Cu permease
MKQRLEQIAERVIEWIGSVASLVVHTVFFVVVLALRLFGVSSVDVLLILTTIVSLEAIYLAILNQMTLNKHTKSIQEVRTDVETLQTDVEEMLDEDE